MPTREEKLLKTIERILEHYGNSTQPLTSSVYGDNGIEPLTHRLQRAALNQVEDGAAMFSRYAIWANTVRDNIAEALRQVEHEAPKQLLIKAHNSLSAFSEIQALFDTLFDQHSDFIR